VSVKHITLAIDDQTLEAGRIYACRHQTTLNALVRELLVRTPLADRHALANEMFRLMDTHPGDSERKQWTREELYVRRGRHTVRN
jgi:hypothetical protein